MAMLTLRIDDELDKTLQWLVETSGHTKTYWATRFIREGIADLEPTPEEIRAIKTYRRDKEKGIDRSVPFEVVVEELNARIMAAENRTNRKKTVAKTRSSGSPKSSSRAS